MVTESRELQKLSARHDFVIKLHVDGLNNREIARATGFCEEHIPVIVGSPIAQTRIAAIRDKLDDSHIEGVNLARQIVAENAPRLSLHLVDLALTAKEENTQLSACAKALAFAEGGVTKEQEGQTSLVINITDKNGEIRRKADIFEGAAIVDMDDKAGSKALALAEGTEVSDG